MQIALQKPLRWSELEALLPEIDDAFLSEVLDLIQDSKNKWNLSQIVEITRVCNKEEQAGFACNGDKTADHVKRWQDIQD